MKKTVNGVVAFMLVNALALAFTAPQALAQDVQVSFGVQAGTPPPAPPPPPPPQDQNGQISFQAFYDQLAPYGQWINDPYYGNVFVPNVPMGFRPYASDGYWAMTDQGNMWMSDEPWSWACYHYGRWTYNSYYGWLWIPGYQWAPAWVSWRSGGGYYGWAPMGPGYNPGGVYNYPDNYWVFVTPEYLYRPNVYAYYGHEAPGVYIGRTTYLNETYGGGGANYYYGPRREMIERETHQPVQVYHVGNAGQPGTAQIGGGNQINIYHPPVNQATVGMARPANVMPAENHPIGREPEAISTSHQTSQPAFRQQMQAHNAGSNYGGANQAQPQRPQPQQPQQRPQPQQFQRPQPQAQQQQAPQQRPQPQQQAQPQRPQQQAQPPKGTQPSHQKQTKKK